MQTIATPLALAKFDSGVSALISTSESRNVSILPKNARNWVDDNQSTSGCGVDCCRNLIDVITQVYNARAFVIAIHRWQKLDASQVCSMRSQSWTDRVASVIFSASIRSPRPALVVVQMRTRREEVGQR